MYATFLRAGLWTFILVLILYVFVSAYPDQPFAEMIPTTMLQQGIVFAAILVAIGVVMRILGKGASVVVKNRCRVCKTPIPSGAMYCRAHLREILYKEEDRTHASRIKR